MEKKPKPNPNSRKQKINQPNRIVANPQNQNTELRKQVTKPQNTTRIVKKRVKKKPGVSINKRQFSELSRFQFYAITVSVVLIILSIFSFSSFLARQNTSKSSQTAESTSSPTQPPVPLETAIPIEIPGQNQPVAPLTNPQLLSENNSSQFVYNITTPPQLINDNPKLKEIVSNLVNYAKEKKLPTDSLSITLIDLNQGAIAAHKQNTPRYPASVAKLFWMVAAQSKLQQRQVPLTAVNAVDNDLKTMMFESDNDAASNVIDAITNTRSSDQKLDKAQFAQWKQQRESLNDFFQKAGYKDINISQKTFPLPLHNIKGPAGADEQIRGDNPSNPRRNKITTYQAARLMYEIVKGEAVAPEYQDAMLGLLRRDLGYWQSQPPNPEEFDPVRYLFGEKLPANQVQIYSKAGWTTNSRQEVAYIATNHGKARYILAIFGDDQAYGDSQKSFPQMSRLVFDQMTK